jgi:hypothetical protein
MLPKVTLVEKLSVNHRSWPGIWCGRRAGEYASLIAHWVADGYLAAARGPTAAVMSPATDGGIDELEQ